MTIFKGLSKEFQVGALTSIAITILILGYNYMRGNDNPFKSGTDIYVYYDSAQGLGIGTSVMYNGLRIGQLSAIGISEDGNHIKTRFEIKASLNIPVDSKMEIQTQIFGGQKVRLIMGQSDQFISDGDTLSGVYAHDQFSAINDQMVPLVSKADSMLTGLNAFFTNPHLNSALQELPLVLLQMEALLKSSRSMLLNNELRLNNTLENFEALSSDLKIYNKQMGTILTRLDKSTEGLDSIKMASTLVNINHIISSTRVIVEKMEKGEGSIGALLNSDTTVVLLNKNLNDLNKVLLDLKKYPEKYVPVPFTNKQRKKAKKASLDDKEVWSND